MRKNPLKARSAMNVSVQHGVNLRRLPLVALLSATLLCSGSLPVYAQDPGQNTAALNFVGADIESVVKAIGHYTGVTFIIDPRVKGQINLVSEKPLTKDQAFKLLTSSLRLQGYSVVTGDGYSKVVPESDAKLQAGPIQAESLKGDQVATQIYRLNYESANNIVTVLRPLISPNNTINANPGNNSVVITDYADNIKRLTKIINALDVPASNDVDVIPVKHAIASDLAAMVAKLTETAGPSADGGRAVLLADPRTNSIMIKAPSSARGNLLKSLIAKLDQPTTLPGNVHVVYLKNAEAVKLAQTLRSIYTQDSSLPTSSGSTLSSNSSPAMGANTGATGGLTSSASNTPSAASGSNSASSLSSGGAGGFIQADAATNTLIITASDAVYRNLRGVIDQLDARRAQVYVEALIVEIKANKENEFGIQWLGLSGDKNSDYRVGGSTSFQAAVPGNNLASLIAGKGSVLPGAGLTLGLFKQVNGQLGLGALAHALESNGNGNVLSIPTLITLDNEEAKISVGQNVPFITGQYASTGSTGGSGVNPFTTVERKDVGLLLKVKPQISDGGTIKMNIYQEVSNVDKTVVNTSGLITNKSVIESNVLVDDGQIIALGGLMKDTTDDSNEGVPLLSEIPVLGNLFKYQTKSRGKTSLMIFIRPIVIRNAEQSNNVSLDRYDYMRAQIAPTKQADATALLPEIEKGKLFKAPAAGSVDKSKTDSKESK
ncbi:type II secretion system secretin GspD [Undibacterium sp. Jales W-56]|uniref:type II secretion system secretin GspD n=1 Tax=Undibacterium sp. Jales W-56 TaxID=2897325 RepID=UPI0021CEBE23|nr:type II secretion system secretin GspD [Undibacterium sp. Jales W-56]MCU6433146.1 type II secretion system secretin GspD [Undibacterium sp. Jales W-56]